MAPFPAKRARPHTLRKRKATLRMLASARVAAAVETMAGPTGTARFAAGKVLTVTAAREPGRVYPYIDAIAGLLASDSKIVRWNAMQILALLAPVDTARKLDAVVGTFFRFINGKNLVSATNAIRALARIARQRTDLIERVLPAILSVEHCAYETPDCTNVAIGQALDALQELWPQVRGRPEVTAFVLRQRSSTRAAVARRAARMSADLAR